jgi:ribonuclease III
MTDQLLKAHDKIEAKLHYVFHDKKLLERAFTHRSFINEHKEYAKEHNERLEFLGDAILGLLISEFLYRKLPEAQEGALSYLRSRLVDASTCCQYIHKLDVQEYLLMGRGEMMNAGKGRDSILADLLEALLGAVYIDAGIDATKQFFFHHFDTLLFSLIKEPFHNWKAMLQDYFQKKFQKQPMYKVLGAEGPDHEKVFYIGVYLDDTQLGTGKGLSKKEAEQQAAQHAYEQLSKE